RETLCRSIASRVPIGYPGAITVPCRWHLHCRDLRYPPEEPAGHHRPVWPPAALSLSPRPEADPGFGAEELSVLSGLRAANTQRRRGLLPAARAFCRRRNVVPACGGSGAFVGLYLFF